MAVLGLLGLTYCTLVITRRQKRIIETAKEEIEQQKRIVEDQKQVIEEKNRDILDSINYAKRIQQALLPSMESWYRCLPSSFVLYLPRDIVAGDFY